MWLDAYLDMVGGAWHGGAMNQAVTQTPGAPPPMPRREADPDQYERELIGRNILAARQHVGLTQAELSIVIGADRTEVSAWERARRKPNAARLLTIAAATGHGRDIGWFYREPDDDGRVT